MKKYEPKMCETCEAGCCTNVVGVVDVYLDDINVLDMEMIDYDGLNFTMKRKPNGECVHLNDNKKCNIYKDRPKTCREYPRVSVKPGFCVYKERAQ